MNIYDYIKEYGCFSFKEKKFNEIDASIFSFISYADIKNNFINDKKIKLKNIKIRDSKHNIIAVKEANKILKLLKDTKRYGNCILFNYYYEAFKNVQFGVVSIKYQRNKIFVSYEGTDDLFSGWLEDLMFSYKYPTYSQSLASKYLNKYYKYSLANIILGGHSKGGNLALIAGLNCNFLTKLRIKEIYNIDGPNLLEDVYKSKSYKKIKDKYVHIIPNYSFIGLLLNHDNDIVVSSTNHSIMAHNIIYWEIEKDKFKRASLSSLSKEFDKEIKIWYKKYTNKEKEEVINNLNEVLDKANITSIIELYEKHTNILKIIKSSNMMTENTKKILLEFVYLLIKCIKTTKKNEFKLFINNVFKIK